MKLPGLTLLLILPVLTCGQEFDDWTHYGGGQHGMQYSSLAQINKDNVDELEQLWLVRTGELGQRARRPFAFQANPVHIGGMLYFATGSAIVIAVDASTGQEVWRYNPEIERDVSYAEIANRGVTSWIDPTAVQDQECRHRILVGTLDARLIALDGANGRRCSGFGNSGEIYLDQEIRADGKSWRNYTITSPPVVVNDVIVVGSAIGDNNEVESELGIVRGLDVRTGRELWRWDPIPRDPEDPAHATWDSEEAARNGSANAWPPLAADVNLGLVYVPTGSPSPDFYGGERKGDNLYANSLVALHAATGKIAWYRQLIHHDVWDYDLASQPTLVELRRNGATIPAVLQGTKTGYIFSFDRRNGEPVFAIEERPVPQGGVDGEYLSPTQPFPVAPPALSRQAPLGESDAWGMLYFDKSACAERLAGLRSEGIFTPPSIQGSAFLPGYGGGINWGGLAFDPERQVVVTLSNDIPMEVALIPRDQWRAVANSGEYDGQQFSPQEGTPYGMRRGAITSFLDVPCIEPPFGNVFAIDMTTGDILWQKPLGTLQDVAPAPVPNLEIGMPGFGGPIVTAGGLIFIASVMDNYLRALDTESGEILWEGRLPAGGQATPMTYLDDKTGRQVVIIAAGGHPNVGTTLGDFVVAFALPKN